MAEDSEKRFHSIMDKLFHAPPKPKSNSTRSSEVQSPRGKKRPYSTSALSMVESKSRRDMVEGFQNSSSSAGPLQAPPCRPWDRGDLMRRLATFKSMTWFAKPKVASAVNCARRGWVNVDMDIIACEACGARLLFSTPSSWTQQQVEKAALVFSLKLDNGHKLLCPWIDNACDETLARFPPTTAHVLVDGYKDRSFALLQLLALPVISSSTIDYVRSPQLDHFLTQSSMLECGNGSADTSRTEYLGDECEAVSANLYYQAQKLISLCGWEPRSLPYVVDCKDQSSQSAKHASFSDLSHAVAHGQNPSISVYSSGTNEIMEANEDPMASSGLQSDPNSVVLDCSFCGASVGLWAFSTVPRPVELFRLVGYSEVSGENDSAHCKQNVGAPGAHNSGNENCVGSREGSVNTASSGATLLKERPLSLNLTIAGGPPPTKQNFRATISLPVIGRNLRAQFSSNSDFRDRLCFNQEDIPSDSQNKNVLETSVESEHNVVQGSDQNDKVPENTENVGTVNPAVGDFRSCQVRDSSITTPDANVTIRNGETSEIDSSMMVVADNCNLQQFLGTDIVCSNVISLAGHQESSRIASGMEANVNGGNACKIDFREGEIFSDVLNTPCAWVTSQDSNGVKDRVQTPVNNQIVACGVAKDLKQLPFDKAMEFDPIRQHRHFCPWIASTSSAAPGWQQTLSALQRQKEFSHPSPSNSPSPSKIEVDDPIASIRKLFMSPSAKRVKRACGSS